MPIIRIHMNMNVANDTVQYLLPHDLSEAVRLLADEHGCVIAGGTDVYPALGGVAPTQPVIDISKLDELTGLTTTEDHHRLGALTTWSEIASAADLPRSFAGLRQAAREVGSVQIQNVATIGGNLCNASPAADGVPPLLTLDASVELASVRGTRVVSLESFLLDYRKTALEPDELLTAVLVPKEVDSASAVFEKLGSRQYLVISIVMVAVLLEADGFGVVTTARAAVGACSPVAMRLAGLEDELLGRQIDDELEMVVRDEHIAGLRPIDDVRASSEYRHDAALTLLRRSLRRCRDER